ncbi:MAG TPA: phage integrase N-terminal SAM-like domain-containing protein [Nitrososphaeraceae archaeon]|nr:phage integrase N-terminal SAM-like domain-containing protein [Nitrososphaeraceae archaeon]
MLIAEPNFERRLNELCEDLPPYVKRHLSERISRENASTIIEYINALRLETNVSVVYKGAVVDTLSTLAKFHPGKSFKDMTRDDIIAFLNRLRKTEEQDKKHRWMGTYEQNIRHLKRFYKWLYYPLVEPKQRSIPEQMQNVNPLRRKEFSNYEDYELWLDPDCNRIFLKYCPSKRDKAFHAMMFDTSCRPKELLTAKIEDVQFIDEGYNQRHAIIHIVGKSGKRIKKMLYNSLPYVKDWLQVHPTPDNPKAHLLCGGGKRNIGRKLHSRHYSHKYNDYKKYFQSVLLKLPDSDVSAEDKEIIRAKMLTKPWKPYVLRYSSLTEKANGQLSEYQLREHADWTPTSQMPRKYLKFRGDESIKALQRVHGIVPITEEHNNGSESGTLAPALVCYNCKEPNKAGSRICSNPSCKMILNFEAHVEMQQETDNMKKELAEIKAQSMALRNDFTNLAANLMARMRPGETIEFEQQGNLRGIHIAPSNGAFQRFVTEYRKNPK